MGGEGIFAKCMTMIIINQCGFYQRDANDAMFKPQRLKKMWKTFV